MTPTPEGRVTEAMVERGCRAFDDAMGAFARGDSRHSFVSQILNAALSVPAPEPQPVAWMRIDGDTVTDWVKRHHADSSRDYTAPLYAAAPRERTEGERLGMPENAYRGNLRYAFARGAIATGAWTQDEALAAAYLAWPDVPAARSATPTEEK